MILGIVLHATLPYIAGMEILWPADRESSTTLRLVFEFIHIWRMPLFFLLAGFFANLLINKKSWPSWWFNRLMRLGVPIMIFFPLLGLTIPWIFEYGRTGEFRFFYSNAGQPFHLWFLWHLLVFTLFTILFRPIFMLYRLIAAILTKLGLGSLVNGLNHFRRIPAGIIFRPRIPLGFIFLCYVVSIPTGGELILNPMLGALYFILGYSLYGNAQLLSYIKTSWIIYLVFALIFFIMYWLIMTFESKKIIQDFYLKNFQLPDVSYSDILYLIKVLFKSICGVLFSYALIGLAESKMKHHRNWSRFIADGSYWMYLVHLPLVTLMTFMMFNWTVPPLYKFATASIVTLIICLVTYKYFVRKSFIGILLNGRRAKKT